MNFYNILTQEPAERRLYSAGEHYIGGERFSTVLSNVKTEHVRFTLTSTLFCLSQARQARRHIVPLHSQSLSELMNGAIRKKLGIIPQNVTWGGTASRE